MPDQIVPVTSLDQVGVVLDRPPVTLPPNSFSDARNVRFKDGSVRKMEGEVNIFPTIFNNEDQNASFDGSRLKYIVYWPNPNVTVANTGYYVYITEEQRLDNAAMGYPVAPDGTSAQDLAARDVVYIALPEQTPVEKGNFTPVSNNFGRWQHTFFQGGFALVINNGLDAPHYILDVDGNSNVLNNTSTTRVPNAAPLPGWESYRSEAIAGVFSATLDQPTFELSRALDFSTEETVVTITRGDVTGTAVFSGVAVTPLQLGNEFVTISERTVPRADGVQVTQILFGATNVDTGERTGTLLDGDSVSISVRSSAILVTAGVIRSFGDILVAGNLREVLRSNPDITIRNLSGVVRTSDVAPPGSVPTNWNPFAAGVSTADEFTLSDTGVVQDMAELQGNFYIYSNVSISVLRQTGNPTVPFAVSTVTDSYGAQGLGTVLEFDGQHFVVGSNDIYIFGGHPGSIKSIADGKVRRYFFDELNPLFDQSFFCLRYQQRDEIWVCFPNKTTPTGESNVALIWNYRLNNWTIRDLYNVVSGDVAPIPGGGLPSSTITLQGDSGNSGIELIGAQEVRTVAVDSTISVNGELPDGQREVQRICIVPDSFEGFNTPGAVVVDFLVGEDFDSGPSPLGQRTSLDFLNQPVDELATVTLTLEYVTGTILASQWSGSADRDLAGQTLTITGADLGLSGAGDAEDFVTALATNLNSDSPAMAVMDSLGWAEASSVSMTGRTLNGFAEFSVTFSSASTMNTNPQILLSPQEEDNPARFAVITNGMQEIQSLFIEETRGIGAEGVGSAPGIWSLTVTNPVAASDGSVLPRQYELSFPAQLNVDNLGAFSYNPGMGPGGTDEFVDGTGGSSQYEADATGLAKAIVDFLNSDPLLFQYFSIYQLIETDTGVFAPLPQPEFIVQGREAQGEMVWAQDDPNRPRGDDGNFIMGQNVDTSYVYPSFDSLGFTFSTVVGSGTAPDVRATTLDKTIDRDETEFFEVTADNIDINSENYDPRTSGADVGDYIYEGSFTLMPSDLAVVFRDSIDTGDTDADAAAIIEYVTEHAGENQEFFDPSNSGSTNDNDEDIYEDRTNPRMRMFVDTAAAWSEIDRTEDFEFMTGDFRPELGAFLENTLRWRVRIPAGATRTMDFDSGDLLLEANFVSEAVSSNGGNGEALSGGRINRSGVSLNELPDTDINTPPKIHICSVPVQFAFDGDAIEFYDDGDTVEPDEDLFYSDTDTSDNDQDPIYDGQDLGSFRESEAEGDKISQTIAFSGDFRGDDRFEHAALTLRDQINSGPLGAVWIATHVVDDMGRQCVEVVSRQPQAYEFRLCTLELDNQDPFLDPGVGLDQATNPDVARITDRVFDFEEITPGVTPVTGDRVVYPNIVIRSPEGLERGFRLTNDNAAATDPITANQIMEQIYTQMAAFDEWTSTLPMGYTNFTDSNFRRIAGAENDEGTTRHPVGRNPWTLAVDNYGNTGATREMFIPDLLDSFNNDMIHGTDVSGTDADFRGRYDVRSQRSVIAFTLTNPASDTGTQLFLYEAGLDGDYNPDTHDLAASNGLSVSSSDLVPDLVRYMRIEIPELSISARSTTVFVAQPAFYDATSVFINEILINDTQENTDRINELITLADAGEVIEYHPSSVQPTYNLNEMGEPNGVLRIQSYAPTPEGTIDTQAMPTLERRPSYINTHNNEPTDILEIVPVQSDVFDIERPWPKDEINPNLEYPIFAQTRAIDGDQINKITAADIGWSIPAFDPIIRQEDVDVQRRYLNITGNDARLPYESYVERRQLAIAPEFTTEQLQSVAMWIDGRTQSHYVGPFQRNRVQLRVQTTDNPGELSDLSTEMVNGGVLNNFFVSEDYKVDTRIHGRFMNFRITDLIPGIEGDTPNNEADPEQTNYNQQTEWRLAGLQADIKAGGTR